jgi:hypothetical protein
MRIKNLLVAVITCIAIGCRPFPVGSRERATVIFINDTLDKVDVYATISSSTVRIGSVFASHTDTLFVPSSVTDHGGQTSIVARLLGRSLQPSTGPITLRSTDRIRVRLTSDGRNLFVTPD